jgi:hypothetical protein
MKSQYHQGIGNPYASPEDGVKSEILAKSRALSLSRQEEHGFTDLN